MSIRRITFAKAGVAALALSFIMMTALAGCPTETDPPAGPPAFVAVTGITGVPTQATVNGDLTLSGTVVPSTATNKTIVWSKQETGTTAAATVSSAGVVNATGAGTLKVTATIANGATGTTPYTQDFTITVYAAGSLPTVSSVAVSPAAATVAKGGNKTFTATVNGTNSPSQSVTWSIVETNRKAGTTITTGGVLTVASDEVLNTLTVKAASDADSGKSGTAAVTVSAASPTVTSVTIDPATATVSKGGTQQFSATVAGTGSPAQTVTWTITTAGKHSDTTISATGFLTVAAGETQTSLEIKAASTADTAKSGAATVTVGGGPSAPTWTAVADSTFGADNPILGIAWSGSTFVAVSYDGKMATSPDGITWTAVTNSTFGSSYIKGIAWGGASGAEKFVAGGYLGKMAYSPDGTSWTFITPSNSHFGGDAYARDISGIAWGGGAVNKFVAVSDGGGTLDGYASGKDIAYSSDGISWTGIPTTSGFGSTHINGVAWGGPAGNEKFVAVGNSGKMAYSLDGISWPGIYVGTGAGTGQFGNTHIYGIAWGGPAGNEKFVAVGNGGTMAYSD